MAHLALDDVDVAAEETHHSCVEALSGRVPTSQFTSLTLLAAWRLHDGDRDRALELLRECRFYREPSGQLLHHHLARELGVEEEARARMMESWPPTPEVIARNRVGGIDVIRDEMARRGWR